MPELPRQEDLLEDFGLAPARCVVGEFSNGLPWIHLIQSISDLPKVWRFSVHNHWDLSSKTWG